MGASERSGGADGSMTVPLPLPGRQVLIGNREWMRQNGLEVPMAVDAGMRDQEERGPHGHPVRRGRPAGGHAGRG